MAGDQTVSSTSGSINIAARGGNDLILLDDGINLRGTIDGGPGVDTIDYSPYATAVSVNLGTVGEGLDATPSSDQLSPRRDST